MSSTKKPKDVQSNSKPKRLKTATPTTPATQASKAKAPTSADVEKLKKQLKESQALVIVLSSKFNKDEIEKRMFAVEAYSQEEIFKDGLVSAMEQLKRYAQGESGSPAVELLEKKAQQLEEKLAKAEKTIKDKDSTIETLQRSNSKLEKDLSNSQLNSKKGELPNIKNANSSEENKKLKSRHDEVVKQNEMLTQEMKKLTEDIKELKKDRNDKSADVDKLKENVQNIEKDKSRIETELAQQSLEVDKLRKQLQANASDTTTKSQDDDLRQELQKKDGTINTLEKEINAVEKRTNAEIDEIRKKYDTEKQSTKTLTEEKKNLKEELQNAESQYQELQKAHAKPENTDQEVTDLKQQLETERKAHQKIKSEKEDLENKCHDAFVQIDKKDKEIKQIDGKYQEVIGRKEETINALRKEKSMLDHSGGVSKAEHMALKAENDQLKTRLSKMAGDQLMNNNPNITDLSDENRPTKLGEKYSELYDNEWTDAFEDEEKEGGSEEAAVKTLYTILLDVHLFCQRLSKDHSDSLKTSVRSLPNSAPNPMTDSDIPVTKLRQLKDIRKSFAPDLVQKVAENYVEKKKPKIKGKPNTEKYIRRCVEICWLMSVQDPPVVINDKITSGAFDADVFRTYTKTGKNVDFVVWPPLLLHENGPLLCKGVAQGK